MRLRALPLVVAVVACSSGEPRRVVPAEIQGYSAIATFEVEDGSIADAVRLASGRVLVRASPNFIGVFDSTGSLVERIGRGGSGPGEFRQLSWAAAGGPDSIWAYDLVLKRISLFSEEGEFLSSWRLEGTTFPSVMARQADGGFILIDPFMPTPARSGGLRPHVVGLFSLRLPDLRPRRIAERPWWTMFQASDGVAMIGQPFGPAGHVAASSSSFWFGFGDRPELEEIDTTGTVARRLALSLAPVTLSAADEAWARGLVSRPTTIEGVQQLYAAVPLPATRPFFTRLLADKAQLWVQLARVADSVPGMWIGRSTDSAAADTLHMPAGLELLSVSSPYLLARYSNSSDNEFVRLYRRVP